MIHPYRARAYEVWAPVIARVVFGLQFLLGAAFKIPGTAFFSGEVAQTAAAGVPFATVLVFLAFIIEVVCGLMLVFGWHARKAAFVLAPYTLILALVFYRNIADVNIMGEFISHLAFIAGLLYVSVYGAQHAAVRKDPLPNA
ncbi:MAG TPA: DoxX family protein [Candidatus Paceibacterota bacterium]|jgi:putative oxidoreductase|nr:DoxX family protein [Candidatus Paceibacterota bacterium]